VLVVLLFARDCQARALLRSRLPAHVPSRLFWPGLSARLLCAIGMRFVVVVGQRNSDVILCTKMSVCVVTWSPDEVLASLFGVIPESYGFTSGLL
jgi:hypothetical protein